MRARSKKLTLALFVTLSVGFAVNIHFLQKPNSDGTIGQRSAANLAPLASEQQRLKAADSAAQPDNTSKQGVIVINSGIKSQTTRAIQRELGARGYNAGEHDGIPSLATRAAIMAYEHDHGLPITGTPNKELLQKIVFGGATSRVKQESSADEAIAIAQQKAQVIRTVQQSLKSIGYMPGAIDGHMGQATARAIREFEVDQDMPETGRISGRLIARLATLAGQGRLASR